MKTALREQWCEVEVEAGHVIFGNQAQLFQPLGTGKARCGGDARGTFARARGVPRGRLGILVAANGCRLETS